MLERKLQEIWDGVYEMLIDANDDVKDKDGILSLSWDKIIAFQMPWNRSEC